MVKVLVNKKTNERKSFMLVDESKLKAQKQDNHEIYNYNMDKLEVEYDYETDQEQVTLSRKHLETDFFEAVKFSVVDCPMVLCGNLNNDIKNLKDKDFFN
uniref:Uncharacterized protein n=1 Tax=Strombidinopsis acuminata TaxID=141414 RepID=A0A7S3SXT7_9SPIT|mmetsp:Transcript_47623/g.64600  ORF Transcript_47623/g.64600 Transcript_47623/m.64600 type:complete len:100 (+) Transcript_47623:478-777(+)